MATTKTPARKASRAPAKATQATARPAVKAAAKTTGKPPAELPVTLPTTSSAKARAKLPTKAPAKKAASTSARSAKPSTEAAPPAPSPSLAAAAAAAVPAKTAKTAKSPEAVKTVKAAKPAATARQVSAKKAPARKTAAVPAAPAVPEPATPAAPPPQAALKAPARGSRRQAQPPSGPAATATGKPARDTAGKAAGTAARTPKGQTDGAPEDTTSRPVSPGPSAAPTGVATAAAAAEPPAPAMPAAQPTVAPDVATVVAVPAAPARPPAPTGPPDSALTLVTGDQHQLLWRAGSTCPPALAQAMAKRVDAEGHLPPEDDEALPALLRGAAETGHHVAVSPAVWAHLATHRDARSRCALLQAAYPDGPASQGLQGLLGVALPLYQAEGALWAVVAGRALLADEPGLGKGVQALAAAQLWRRHAGVRRVLVLCPPALLAHWQRAWQLLAGVSAQVMSGGLHQRQALWSSAAEVRLIAPEALASDAAHLARWAPELVIVDEPQRLGTDDQGAPVWAGLQAPHALVLCGAALDTQPDLLDALVAWLDPARLGPLAALREVRAARDARRPLSEPALERVAAQLSRVLLQRQRAEVIDQLPPVVYAPRLLPMSAAQHEAHAQTLTSARQLVAGWQASGYLSDADQWRLSAALMALQQAAHRADPAEADSPLAEAVLQAAQDLLLEAAECYAPDAPPTRALLCDSVADAQQWAQRLGPVPGLHLVAPGQALPDAPDQVWQVGVPWRTRRHPIGDRDRAPHGQHWVLLSARDSIDIGLLDTLAERHEVPRGPAEPGGRGFLAGDRLATWLQAVAGALQAIPADTPLVAAQG